MPPRSTSIAARLALEHSAQAGSGAPATGAARPSHLLFGSSGSPRRHHAEGLAVAMAAFGCSGVAQPSLANDEVVYLRLDDS